jgi:hypothetical protein
MKHKHSKRSISNKQSHHQVSQTQTRRSSTPRDYKRTISSNKSISSTESADSDSYTKCLKPNVPLKSQKLLKRDLLRCSNQRPSLLGPQTLQPLRINNGSQQIPCVELSSSRQNAQLHCSLPDNARKLRATIDRIGPWPDISINCLRSNGNDLIQPLKNFRNSKNPIFFSTKYYGALDGNINKFQFHPSARSYIEEYRKEKGYLISSCSKPQGTSLSLSSLGLTQKLDDDQLSTCGTCSRATGSNSVRNQSDVSIGRITKSADDVIDNNRSPTISNNLPSLSVRNHSRIRLVRSTQHQQTIILPTIKPSSFQYLNSKTPIQTVYNENKKFSKPNQSKLYIIDGRQQKRYWIFLFLLFNI